MERTVAKTANIAVIGQGLAGLSMAFALGRAGFERVTILGPRSVPGTASSAAVGVVTLKGWNEPRLPLFVAKYLGHKSLHRWLAAVEQVSEKPIRQIWGRIYEPFADEASYQALRKRIYHHDFTGTLAVDVLSDPPLPDSISCAGAFHYWQDGWIHAADLLASLREAATRYGFAFIEQRVAALDSGPGSSLVVKGKDGILGQYDEVMLCAGIFCNDIELPASVSLPRLRGVSGWTLVSEESSDRELAVISGKMSLVQGPSELRWGSTSSTAGIHRDEHGFSDREGPAQVMYLFDFARKFGYNRADCQALFGVRGRTADRQPLVGPVDFGDSGRLWVAAGLYKNGMQLAHLIAENLVTRLLGLPVSPLFQHFVPTRFFSDV